MLIDFLGSETSLTIDGVKHLAAPFDQFEVLAAWESWLLDRAKTFLVRLSGGNPAAYAEGMRTLLADAVAEKYGFQSQTSAELLNNQFSDGFWKFLQLRLQIGNPGAASEVYTDEWIARVRKKHKAELLEQFVIERGILLNQTVFKAGAESASGQSSPSSSPSTA